MNPRFQLPRFRPSRARLSRKLRLHKLYLGSIMHCPRQKTSGNSLHNDQADNDSHLPPGAGPVVIPACSLCLGSHSSLRPHPVFSLCFAAFQADDI